MNDITRQIRSYIAFKEGEKDSAIRFFNEHALLSDKLVSEGKKSKYKIIDPNGNYYNVINGELILDKSQSPEEEIFLKLCKRASFKEPPMIVRYNDKARLYIFLIIFLVVIFGIYYVIKHD